MSGRLHLGIEDEEDLAIVAACVQDAVVKAAEMSFLKGAGRFALVLNRFRWEAGEAVPSRVRCGLHFDRVVRATSRGIDGTAVEQVLELLTIDATPCDVGHRIDLVFAGEAVIRLEAEAIEGGFRDLGEPWVTRRAPRHEVE